MDKHIWQNYYRFTILYLDWIEVYVPFFSHIFAGGKSSHPGNRPVMNNCVKLRVGSSPVNQSYQTSDLVASHSLIKPPQRSTVGCRHVKEWYPVIIEVHNLLNMLPSEHKTKYTLNKGGGYSIWITNYMSLFYAFWWVFRSYYLCEEMLIIRFKFSPSMLLTIFFILALWFRRKMLLPRYLSVIRYIFPWFSFHFTFCTDCTLVICECLMFQSYRM